MLNKNFMGKLAVLLFSVVLFLNSCSYLPEIYYEKQRPNVEDEHHEFIEPDELQEKLPEDELWEELPENNGLPDDNTHITGAEEEARLVISAVGDIMTHVPLLEAAKQPNENYDFKSMFDEIKDYLERADVVIGNLETTISPPEKGYGGYPRFRAPEQLLEAFKYAGFDVLITANNHCLDGLELGLEYTLDKLDEYGLMHTGTARNVEERNSHLIIEKKDMRIGILAYTYGTNGMEALVPKKKLSYMVNYYNDYRRMTDDIKSMKEADVNLIIVYMHWGYEYHRVPNNEQKKLVEMLANEGVDIIFGCHPHVVQPMELKRVIMEDGTEKNVLVAYSLGNFLASQKTPNTDAGVIVNVEIVKDPDKGISIDRISYVPTWIYKYEQNGKLGFRVLPIRKYLDYEEFDEESTKRIKTAWEETTDILDIEPFELED